MECQLHSKGMISRGSNVADCLDTSHRNALHKDIINMNEKKADSYFNLECKYGQSAMHACIEEACVAALMPTLTMTG
eukprot:38683-Prorocentrum_lima.AAC.1